jgi:hypothetical protein
VSQLTNKHKKVNKVVKIIKNNETPSTPKVKFRFKLGNQKILVVN